MGEMMEKMEILNLTTIVLSDIVFMIAMIVIVLIAACFLGRYIVITRKMVIATLGIIILQILFLVISSLVLSKMYPELTAQMEAPDFNPELLDNQQYHSMLLISTISSYVVNISVFVYAFIFYLLAFKEKKLLRAIESTICLYLYYYYFNTMAQYMFVYFRGGDVNVLFEFAQNMYSKTAQYLSMFLVTFDFGASIILLLILYFGYYKKKKFYRLRIRDRVFFVVWLVLFSTFPSVIMYSDKVSEQFKYLCYVFGALIPIMGGIAPILLVMNAAERSLKDKNEYQETYLNAELEYIEQYKRTQTETRAFRHDIINNLSLTNMMLDEGRVEEAGQHLKELLGNVKALSPSIITGDEMLDCIVSMKADKMKEMGIRFSTDGVVDGGLHMKPMDVCSIFANALDNAIEASSKISGDSKAEPWVDMNIKRNDRFFVIKISNAANEKVDVEKLFMSAGYTSKKDTEHHGFGLRNIRNSVEEYDGIIKAESDEDSFALSIMIPKIHSESAGN